MSKTLHRPDLEAPARELITCAHAVLGVGGGLPLAGLVELFVDEVDAELEGFLTQRGCLEVLPDGVVTNTGRAHVFKGSVFDLQLPARLAGKIVGDGAGFRLELDSRHTLVAKMGFMKFGVDQLAVQPDGATIALSRSLFDIHLRW